MIRFWDYFMRRKGLVLAILATFLASSILSYNVFRSRAAERPVEFISIRSWGDDEIEVPRTGDLSSPIISVLSPYEVTTLAPRVDPLVAEAPDLADTPTVPDPLDETFPDSVDERPSDQPSPDELVGGQDPADLPSEAPSEDDVSDLANVDGPSDAAGSSSNPTVLSPEETTVQGTDRSPTSTESSSAPRQDGAYLIFLVVIGLIVAGFGTYFFERHFWR